MLGLSLPHLSKSLEVMSIPDVQGVFRLVLLAITRVSNVAGRSLKARQLSIEG